MKIAGLQKVGLIDYPDHIAASLFLAGCNLACAYCYNRWMIRENDVAEVMTVRAFLDWLGTRAGLLDGVCVSGGEPTIHPELPELLRGIKALGLSVKLDTNGTRPRVLSALLDAGLADYVAVDVKAPLDASYHVVAGCAVDLDAIRESVALAMDRAPDYELRTTVGPQLNEGDLEAIAAEIAQARRWVLQPFLASAAVDPALAAAPCLSEEALRQVAERLRRICPAVRVRGL